jgi:hypothetical protein
MSEKKKLSRGWLFLLICVYGLLDTGAAWLFHARGWIALNALFYPVVLFALLVAKEEK